MSAAQVRERHHPAGPIDEPDPWQFRNLLVH
jgi:homospermidine synthase